MLEVSAMKLFILSNAALALTLFALFGKSVWIQ